MAFTSDFLDSIRETVAKSLAQQFSEHGVGIPSNLIDRVALEVVVDIQFEWAGQQIYVAKTSEYLQRRIFEEFDGNNIQELVKKYRLSTKTIYDYIAKSRKLKNVDNQLTLPV